MGARNKKPTSVEALAAALEAKRGQRLDSAELAIINEIAELGDEAVKLDNADNADNADVADTALKKELDKAEPGEKVKLIKDRLDARKKDVAPPKDGLEKIVTQQDSDISDLLEIIESLQAKYESSILSCTEKSFP